MLFLSVLATSQVTWPPQKVGRFQSVSTNGAWSSTLFNLANGTGSILTNGNFTYTVGAGFTGTDTAAGIIMRDTTGNQLSLRIRQSDYSVGINYTRGSDAKNNEFKVYNDSMIIKMKDSQSLHVDDKGRFRFFNTINIGPESDSSIISQTGSWLELGYKGYGINGAYLAFTDDYANLWTTNSQLELTGGLFKAQSNKIFLNTPQTYATDTLIVGRSESAGFDAIKMYGVTSLFIPALKAGVIENDGTSLTLKTTSITGGTIEIGTGVGTPDAISLSKQYANVSLFSNQYKITANTLIDSNLTVSDSTLLTTLAVSGNVGISGRLWVKDTLYMGGTYSLPTDTFYGGVDMTDFLGNLGNKTHTGDTIYCKSISNGTFWEVMLTVPLDSGDVYDLPDVKTISFDIFVKDGDERVIGTVKPDGTVTIGLEFGTEEWVNSDTGGKYCVVDLGAGTGTFATLKNNVADGKTFYLTLRHD